MCVLLLTEYLLCHVYDSAIHVETSLNAVHKHHIIFDEILHIATACITV